MFLLHCWTISLAVTATVWALPSWSWVFMLHPHISSSSSAAYELIDKGACFLMLMSLQGNVWEIAILLLHLKIKTDP